MELNVLRYNFQYGTTTEISVLTVLCRPLFINVTTCVFQCIATLTVYTINIINQSSKQANQLTLLYFSRRRQF